MSSENALQATNLATESAGGDDRKGDRFFVRPMHLIPGAILALVLFAASMAVGGAAAEANSTDGVLLGASSATTYGQTQIEAIQQLERQLGTTLPLVRVFEQWDSKIDNRYNNWIVNGDRQIMMSIKPKTGSNNVITWRSIANAQPGSSLHNNMVRLAREVKELDGEVWLAFHHEPETADTTAWGDSDDFQAAWRKFHTVFKQQGADVNWVWTMTGWGYAVKSTDRRAVAKWYPGNGYVDYVGADLYNWNNCRTAKEGYRTLRSALDPVIAFADSKGKQIVLPEFGSHEDGTGSKGKWLDEVRALMKESKYSSRFALISYYDSIDKGQPSCNWPLDSSAQSLAAAKRIANDPFFRGTSTPRPPATTTTTTAPKTTTTTTVVPKTGDCTVKAVNGADRISWETQGAGFEYNVRRNGKWIANVDAKRSYVNTKATTGNYVIVARNGKAVKRLTCTRSNGDGGGGGGGSLDPIGSCKIDTIDGSNRVTWTKQGDGFTYVVLRNDTKLATTSNTWHWHRNVKSGSYDVRAFKNGDFAELNCTQRDSDDDGNDDDDNDGRTRLDPIGLCRVDRIDGSDLVTWPNQGDGFTYNVWHNGTKIDTEERTWHWNHGTTTGSYTIRAVKGNGMATLDCLRRY